MRFADEQKQWMHQFTVIAIGVLEVAIVLALLIIGLSLPSTETAERRAIGIGSMS